MPKPGDHVSMTTQLVRNMGTHRLFVSSALASPIQSTSIVRWPNHHFSQTCHIANGIMAGHWILDATLQPAVQLLEA